MDFLIELIQTYGYLMVFAGTLLEGETVVALAGFAAYQGYLEASIIIPVAICGAVIGDQVFFYLGRFKGKGMIAKHPEWQPRIEKIHSWMERHQNLLIFGSRFLYGFRAITPIILGTSRVSGIRFLILNLLGAVVWACIFVSVGYFFGDTLSLFLGNIKKFEGVLVLVIVGAGAVVQFLSWRRAHRKPTIAQE